MLNDAVKRDDKAGDKREADGARHIRTRLNEARSEEKDDEIGTKRVKPLQALIRTEQRNSRGNRKKCTDAVGEQEQQRGNCEWIVRRNLLSPRKYALTETRTRGIGA